MLERAVPKVSLPLLERAVDQVERLHAAVDVMVAPLLARHDARLQCRQGCTGCCVDDLSVFEVEAATIKRHYAELLATEPAHAEGQCAFLDHAGACRIYAHRPYVCRTQGLPLRWREDDNSELRDICELNETPEPIEALATEDCWTLGPVEERLRTLQTEAAPTTHTTTRIKLRDLFGPSPA